MRCILDQLAIGNYEEALKPLKEISALLNVAAEKDIPDTNLLYHKIPIIDMKPIPVSQMREAVDWIRDRIHEHKIMVFCNAGVGRSPSVVIGYLCCVLGYGFGEAVEFVAQRKADISTLPNLIKTIEEAKALSNPSCRTLPSVKKIDAKNAVSARKS
jgi:protein-tyrosine phosphatase